ncbi:hypothetical protein GCM10027080_36490 [Pedococcus soli]
MSSDSRSPSARRDRRPRETPPYGRDELGDLVEAVVLLHFEVSAPPAPLHWVSPTVSHTASIQEALNSIDSLVTAARQVRRLHVVAIV